MRRLVVVILACACSRTPPAPAGSLRSAGAAAASGAAEAAGSTSLPAPPLLPDGCWSGLSFDAGEKQLSADLARRCFVGLSPLPLPSSSDGLELSSGAKREISLKLEQLRCVRVAATGGPGIEELELAILQGERSLGEDDLRGRIAIVEPRGPVCLEAGSYLISVRAARGAGPVAVRAYVPE